MRSARACGGLLVALAAAGGGRLGAAAPTASGDRPTSCGVASEGDEIVFDCGSDLISAVAFGSFGQPRGTCRDAQFEINEACHATQTVTALEDRCLGQATCLFVVSAAAFGGAPKCARADGAKRWLAATLECGDESGQGGGGSAARSGLGIGWQFNLLVFSV